jgi:small-conductance mechanosensitive channel
MWGLVFRTRAPSRDDETDKSRLNALQNAVSDMAAQIQSERQGLSARYARFTDTAAFAEVALENGSGPSTAKRLGELSDSIAACSRRLGDLEAQELFLMAITDQLSAFPRSAAQAPR